jgi:hypothetical protein
MERCMLQMRALMNMAVIFFNVDYYHYLLAGRGLTPDIL